MIFLNLQDIGSYIPSNIVGQLQSDNALIDENELQAIGVVKGYLGKDYDIDKETTKTANDRNYWLVRHLLHLIGYYLYQSIADDDIPQRIIKNYNDTLKELESVAKDALSINLDKMIVESQQGEQTPRTAIRIGSLHAKRSH